MIKRIPKLWTDDVKQIERRQINLLAERINELIDYLSTQNEKENYQYLTPEQQERAKEIFQHFPDCIKEKAHHHKERDTSKDGKNHPAESCAEYCFLEGGHRYKEEPKQIDVDSLLEEFWQVSCRIEFATSDNHEADTARHQKIINTFKQALQQ